MASVLSTLKPCLEHVQWSLIQEGNYLSHAWQGEEFKISYTCDLNTHVCRGGLPHDKSPGNSLTICQGSLGIYGDTKKGGIHNPQGHKKWGPQTTAQIAELHIARGCSTAR